LQFWKSAFREVEKQLVETKGDVEAKDKRILELEKQAKHAAKAAAKMQRLIITLKQELDSLQRADEGLVEKLLGAAQSFEADKAS
jgi:chromosome segregation ATPase